ncbi:MAG: hypothetical protein ABL868_05335, partial [Sulfuriferula sp.]
MNTIRPIPLLFLATLILSGFWYMGSALTGLLLIIATAATYRTSFLLHTWQNYALTLPMLAYLAWLFVVAFSSNIPNYSMMTLAVLAGLPVLYLTASNSPRLPAIWPMLR